MKIYSERELTDSRIFFDKQPSNYLRILGYFLIILVIICIFLLKYLPKSYIVRAQGTVEATDKLCVTPLINADIVKIHFKEGDRVKQGDLLLTLSTGTEGVQEKDIDNQIRNLEGKKVIFDKFEKSLYEKKNLLKNEDSEQEYYGKVEYYLSQLSDDQKKNNSTNKELELAQKEMEGLKTELATIESEEYDKYIKEFTRKSQDLEEKRKEKIEVETQISSLDGKKSVQTDSSDFLNEPDIATLSSELTALDEEIKSLQRELEDSTDTYEETLKDKLKSKNDEIKSKQQEIRSLSSQENEQAISTYQQLISDLGIARTQNDEKIQELQAQRNIKSSDSALSTLVANKEGTVHYLTPIKEGLGLQAFQPVAQIDNGEKAKLVVECFISAQDRSRIRVGNSSKIALLGVNQTKFGFLKGEIISIGSGTISQTSVDKNSELLYQVIIDLKDTSLKADNDQINAQTSMPVVANIVYEKETYLEWTLEQLNFIKE
ncbi:HlyD family efflux transporter periplasmic adaptor subunit [Enterococcus gallinarum]|uniref:HlyD family efflux transporter periplasmic adaptor subunit n=1 Tax=Enterococcus gallinarum TaxID=1353 RepID=UPI0018CE6AD7|nr:HlyD family efflux transporter periplasmic adaptor subunit [Enterococcus gallinarum]